MASLTWNPGINSYSPYVVLTVTEQSQSTSGNYSILAYSLKLYRPRQIYSSSSKSYNVKINGKTVASGSTYIGGSGTKTIASGTTKVYHNSDGTKTGVAISFYQEVSITWSGVSTGNASKSGSMNLTTIPRASIPSLSSSNTNLGSSLTIYTNRKSSVFTHTITYDFKGQTGTIGTGISTSKAWTIPKSLANKIPSDTSGTGTIYLKTYNGNTHIGTKSITFKVTVPNTSEFKPSIGTINVSEAVSELASKFGAYIKGKSKLAISYSSSGAYGSSIKTKKISANGATYNSSSATTGYIKFSGTLTIIATITDSRGRTVSKSTTVDVLDYNSPSISKLNVFRSNSDGTENDEGEYAKVEVRGDVTPLNDKNTKSFKIKYKKSNESTYTVVDLDNSAYTLNTSIILSNIDGNFTYDIVFEVNDYFTSTPKLEPLPTAFTLVDYHKDGKSVAFGKVSEGKALIEVGGSIIADDGLYLPNMGFGNNHQIPMIGGGQLSVTSSTVTGAIKIALPHFYTNTMISFWVDVYDYREGTSFSAYITGYAYGAGSTVWLRTSTHIITGNNSKSHHTIRFGNDGSKCCVYIGEVNHTWSYPKVSVRDVQVGHENVDYLSWSKNWNVSIVTSFGTIDSTHEYNKKYYPSLMNGWANYSDSYGGMYAKAHYYKDMHGIVHLGGLVRNGTYDSIVFNLPVGYRPDKSMVFIGYTNSDVLSRIDLYTDGGVALRSGNNQYASLDGVSFYTEQ